MKDGLPWRERKRLREEAELAERNARANVRSAPKRLPPPKPRMSSNYVCGPHPAVTPKPTTRHVPEAHNPHLPRGILPWAVKDRPSWKGRVVHIVGGGPSLKDASNLKLMQEAHELYPDHKWIAVNNSYKIVPWYDLLHFADCEWWTWNGKDVLNRLKRNQIITTATSDVRSVKLVTRQVNRLWRNRNVFSDDPLRVHGWDGGTQAVNLAYHLGVAKIVLWGIDMYVPPGADPQWHREHRRQTNIKNYMTKFAPSLAECVRLLSKYGVPVVRATDPGIPEAPFLPLHEACQAPGGQR